MRLMKLILSQTDAHLLALFRWVSYAIEAARARQPIQVLAQFLEVLSCVEYTVDIEVGDFHEYLRLHKEIKFDDDVVETAHSALPHEALLRYRFIGRAFVEQYCTELFQSV
jgi:hypothetical protein